MKRRGLLIVVLVALAFAGSAAHARAARERCAAELRIGALGIHSGYVLGPARQFGFQLSAQKERTVSGRLVLDTDHGWFTVPFTNVHIAPVDRHYRWIYGDYTERVWESNVLYADIGQTATVNHYYWDQLTTADASAPAAAACYDAYHLQPLDQKFSYLPDPTAPNAVGVPDLSATPPNGAITIAAKSSTPLMSANCAMPFQYARVTTAVVPDLPDSVGGGGLLKSSTQIELFLDANGNIADSWIQHGSGDSQFDANALQAAQNSRYIPAIAYCTRIPSLYIFNARFDLTR